MIWFLERESDLLICEIRRSNDGQYEFETAPSGRPPETCRFASATELIDRYLVQQARLRAQGWRPRGDLATLE